MKSFNALACFLGLLLWSACPMAQHAHDRTWGFWVMWLIMEIYLFAAFAKTWSKLGDE